MTKRANRKTAPAAKSGQSLDLSSTSEIVVEVAGVAVTVRVDANGRPISAHAGCWIGAESERLAPLAMAMVFDRMKLAHNNAKPSRGGRKTANKRVIGEADKLRAVATALRDAKYAIPARGHWKADVQNILKAADITVSDTWLRDHAAALRIRGTRKA